MEKTTLGPGRHILLNPVDRECTAYHESGHALLGLLVPGSDPVHRVAIVPRGMALGAGEGKRWTMHSHDELLTLHRYFVWAGQMQIASRHPK